MRKSKFTEHQIIGALTWPEQGVAVKDICRELGVSSATFYQWHSKYGGLEASDLKKIGLLFEALPDSDSPPPIEQISYARRKGAKDRGESVTDSLPPMCRSKSLKFVILKSSLSPKSIAK